MPARLDRSARFLGSDPLLCPTPPVLPTQHRGIGPGQLFADALSEPECVEVPHDPGAEGLLVHVGLVQTPRWASLGEPVLVRDRCEGRVREVFEECYDRIDLSVRDLLAIENGGSESSPAGRTSG